MALSAGDCLNRTKLSANQAAPSFLPRTQWNNGYLPPSVLVYPGEDQSGEPADVRTVRVRWANLIFRLKRLRAISRSVWSGANTFFHRIGKPIKIKELSLYTEIAREDAAQTAISAGLVWAAQGFLYTRLAEVFNTCNSRNYFMVRPAYTKTNFLLVDYSCIFQFRLGHIIIIIYQMFRSTGEIYSLIRRVSQ